MTSLLGRTTSLPFSCALTVAVKKKERALEGQIWNIRHASELHSRVSWSSGQGCPSPLGSSVTVRARFCDPLQVAEHTLHSDQPETAQSRAEKEIEKWIFTMTFRLKAAS